ncbi:hypothetical protein P692DRAFT_20835078 [Suillus brevipes Sb2]|nr:hypothetical protein P692DRAFT_20835078 [Suillus brevipes Sb2]
MIIQRQSAIKNCKVSHKAHFRGYPLPVEPCRNPLSRCRTMMIFLSSTQLNFDDETLIHRRNFDIPPLQKKLETSRNKGACVHLPSQSYSPTKSDSQAQENARRVRQANCARLHRVSY